MSDIYKRTECMYSDCMSLELQSLYPVIQTTKVVQSRDFFVRHFGFEIAFDSDWYVSLRRGDHQLAFMAAGHDSVPAAGRGAAANLILNFEVDDARAEHTRLVTECGLSEELPLRDEPWGQRHFIVRDPSGVLLDVIELIAPSEEFAAQYSPESLPSS